jgi:hypothetical protein
LGISVGDGADLPDVPGADSVIRWDFARNIMDCRSFPGRQGILVLVDGYAAPSPVGSVAEAYVRRLFDLDEERNIYPRNAHMLHVMSGSTRREGALGQDLVDWNRFWGLRNTGSMEGDIRFQGGDLIRRAQTDPEQLTAQDFRLRPDSAGYRAGPDGKDLGADIDLVGPGEAYERWKKTPEYQEWRRQVVELMKPETAEAPASEVRDAASPEEPASLELEDDTTTSENPGDQKLAPSDS